jgi:REP element-mobilizing transposase RayT
MPHIPRPQHHAGHPVHVTLKSRFRPLRSQYVFPTVRGAIADSRTRWVERFRIVHFSVQWDHIHMIVEADDRDVLLQGVRGLSISIARRVNRLMFRTGKFWDDRWHGRALMTARAVRHAMVYVMGNGYKHGVHWGVRVDPFSSAPYFDGFKESPGRPFVQRDPGAVPRWLHPPLGTPVSTAESWLLGSGWCSLGLISLRERPRSATFAD